MTNRLFVISILALFVIGCKSKKRTTYGSSSKKQTTTVKKKPKIAAYETDGKYPLPNDTGKFHRFSIASVDEYIATFSEIAQNEMDAYGIPASITLAQGLLESGLGKGELAVKTNNHFGIKCHKGWQGDYDFHDDDEKGECFRKYNHPMYSYRDHSEFLSSRSRYSFLFNYSTKDYKSWARGLRKAGYATDKKYPQKLIYLIEKYRLHKFDKGAGSNKLVVNNAPKQFEQKVHIVKKGDTLYSISRRYFISVDEIKRMNNLGSNSLAIGQELTVTSEISKK